MFSDKLDALYSKFTLGEARAGSDASCRSEVGTSSSERRIKPNCGIQYIQVVWTVSGKPEDHNYYQGEFGVQPGVICEIQIMDSVLGSTTLVVNSCDNISNTRRASIHPEVVTPQQKQEDLIYRLSDV